MPDQLATLRTHAEMGRADRASVGGAAWKVAQAFQQMDVRAGTSPVALEMPWDQFPPPR
jgi:hypothetical protein